MCRNGALEQAYFRQSERGERASRLADQQPHLRVARLKVSGRQDTAGLHRAGCVPGNTPVAGAQVRRASRLRRLHRARTSGPVEKIGGGLAGPG